MEMILVDVRLIWLDFYWIYFISMLNNKKMGIITIIIMMIIRVNRVSKINNKIKVQLMPDKVV